MFITYNAPKGDDRVVEYMGVELFDGMAVDLDDTDLDEDQRAHVLAKAKTNSFFTISAEPPAEKAPARRGRPPKGDAADGND